jgi:hypothetical protein
MISSSSNSGAATGTQYTKSGVYPKTRAAVANRPGLDDDDQLKLSGGSRPGCDDGDRVGSGATGGGDGLGCGSRIRIGSDGVY